MFQKAKKIVGIDICDQAIEDARQNASINGDCYYTPCLLKKTWPNWCNFAICKATSAKFIIKKYIKPPILHQIAEFHRNCTENLEPAEQVGYHSNRRWELERHHWLSKNEWGYVSWYLSVKSASSRISDTVHLEWSACKIKDLHFRLPSTSLQMRRFVCLEHVLTWVEVGDVFRCRCLTTRCPSFKNWIQFL